MMWLRSVWLGGHRDENQTERKESREDDTDRGVFLDAAGVTDQSDQATAINPKIKAPIANGAPTT